ncbi:hypothetical protein QOZ88_19305 [Blastococcus sp. BMG 814]|uniref:Uncharacterized protein n=1 Tax=Blastococcus carthaginiensis TaxID=3050034 RepID=A0ABT9IGU7_9ACTN|nr:hypothetical protein [Blastococcus carthaginiensis]MDP5184786.1 hypothetical protein [Blastococcus carthaginiensis]
MTELGGEGLVVNDSDDGFDAEAVHRAVTEESQGRSAGGVRPEGGW